MHTGTSPEEVKRSWNGSGMEPVWLWKPYRHFLFPISTSGYFLNGWTNSCDIFSALFAWLNMWEFIFSSGVNHGGGEMDYPLKGFTAGKQCWLSPKLKFLRGRRGTVLNQVLVKRAHGIVTIEFWYFILNPPLCHSHSACHWLIYINIYYIIFVVEEEQSMLALRHHGYEVLATSFS